MKKRLFLPLDLQFFAEGDPPADPIPPVDPPKPTYTQEDIDRIVGERLAREKQKAEKEKADLQAEAERKRLEEESEFKTLYEAEKAAREQERAEAQAERLNAKKNSLLLEAGYPADKLADLLDFVTGADEEAVKASVEKLVRVAPPKAVPIDPQGGRGQRQAPPQNDGGYEAAREKARKLLKRK